MAKKTSPKKEVVPLNVYLVFDNNMIEINKAVLTLGRHVNNDVIITDPLVSRYHARIEYQQGQFVLVDLDSTAGTFINNARITRQALQSGDNISLARTPVLFIDRSAALVQSGDADTGTLSE